MQRITIKRGDTWAPDIANVDENDVAQPITGWTIASHIRTADGKLVAALQVANRVDAAGTFTLTVPSTTPETSWPTGQLLWDIRYTDTSGRVSSTETMALVTEANITQP